MSPNFNHWFGGGPQRSTRPGGVPTFHRLASYLVLEPTGNSESAELTPSLGSDDLPSTLKPQLGLCRLESSDQHLQIDLYTCCRTVGRHYKSATQPDVCAVANFIRSWRIRPLKQYWRDKFKSPKNSSFSRLFRLGLPHSKLHDVHQERFSIQSTISNCDAPVSRANTLLRSST